MYLFILFILQKKTADQAVDLCWLKQPFRIWIKLSTRAFVTRTRFTILKKERCMGPSTDIYLHIYNVVYALSSRAVLFYDDNHDNT